ncbi:hypothetical protein D5S17_23450 [Pseudonocardiaceae bacterium YIM PH 21723]|nr:hypothetical protein D5S17_23450 [Pseudonocardiaceae bacterium YIM PH 21723]
MDVRVTEALRGFLETRPRWWKRPSSPAEIWEYAFNGDWTENDKSAKRIAYAISFLTVFALTYPIEWAFRLARQSPQAALAVSAALILLYQIL